MVPISRARRSRLAVDLPPALRLAVTRAALEAEVPVSTFVARALGMALGPAPSDSGAEGKAVDSGAVAALADLRRRLRRRTRLAEDSTDLLAAIRAAREVELDGPDR